MAELCSICAAGPENDRCPTCPSHCEAWSASRETRELGRGAMAPLTLLTAESAAAVERVLTEAGLVGMVLAEVTDDALLGELARRGRWLVELPDSEPQSGEAPKSTADIAVDVLQADPQLAAEVLDRITAGLDIADPMRVRVLRILLWVRARLEGAASGHLVRRDGSLRRWGLWTELDVECATMLGEIRALTGGAR